MRDQVAAERRELPWLKVEGRAAVEQIPQAKVQRFDAGHAAFLEQPSAFNAAAEQFLDRS